MIFIQTGKNFKHQGENHDEDHEYQHQPNFQQNNTFAEKESDTGCYETCTKLFSVLAVLVLISGIGVLVYGGVQSPIQTNSMIAGGVLVGSGIVFIIIAVVFYLKATSTKNESEQNISRPTILRKHHHSHRHSQINRNPTILFSSNQGQY
jgi:hypothetical protein